MSGLLDNKLVIAISSRALFDLSDSHAVYETDGLRAYADYQIKREDEPLAPGDAFHLVEKLLNINTKLSSAPRVEVILLSRNSADTGLRIFNSIQHYKLDITRAAFCGGESPYRYVSSFGCHLFLSTHAEDVRQALDSGIAAATILSSKNKHSLQPQLRIAFDGDAVLFSDEAERIFQQDGLAAFTESEKAAANQPLNVGPFKEFLGALRQPLFPIPPRPGDVERVPECACQFGHHQPRTSRSGVCRRSAPRPDHSTRRATRKTRREPNLS